MNITADHKPTFLCWWAEANAELAQLKHSRRAELNFAEARYWFLRNYSPSTAAALQAEENVLPPVGEG
jgi:hypothetical protein